MKKSGKSASKKPPRKKRATSKKAAGKSSRLATADVPLGASRESTIPDYDEAPKSVRRRKIHKRRKVPPVKKGEDVEDRNPSPPADIDKC